MGNFSAQRSTQQQLLISSLVVLIGVFLLLQAATHNWRLAFVLLLTLPAAVSGGILVTLIAGSQITLLNLLGMLAVMGICLRSVILLINRSQTLVQQGEKVTPELVVIGASERFSASLMTMLMVAVVFVLILIFGNAPGHELLFPIAISAVGSLVTAAVYTALIAPALYLRFGAYQEAELELTQEPVPHFG